MKNEAPADISITDEGTVKSPLPNAIKKSGDRLSDKEMLILERSLHQRERMGLAVRMAIMTLSESRRKSDEAVIGYMETVASLGIDPERDFKVSPEGVFEYMEKEESKK